MALRPPLSKGLPLSVPLLLPLLGGGPPIGLFHRPLDPLRTFKRMAASCVTCSDGLGGDGLVKPGAATLRPRRAPLYLAAGPMLCYPGLWGGWSASGSGLDSPVGCWSIRHWHSDDPEWVAPAGGWLAAAPAASPTPSDARFERVPAYKRSPRQPRNTWVLL